MLDIKREDVLDMPPTSRKHASINFGHKTKQTVSQDQPHNSSKGIDNNQSYFELFALVETEASGDYYSQARSRDFNPIKARSSASGILGRSCSLSMQSSRPIEPSTGGSKDKFGQLGLYKSTRSLERW